MNTAKSMTDIGIDIREKDKINETAHIKERKNCALQAVQIQSWNNLSRLWKMSAKKDNELILWTAINDTYWPSKFLNGVIRSKKIKHHDRLHLPPASSGELDEEVSKSKADIIYRGERPSSAFVCD